MSETESSSPAPEPGPSPAELKEQVIDVLRSCFDPEIPVNIYDLGLVYDVSVDEKGYARIVMTLTSPACPVAGTLPGEVQMRVETVPGIERADVDLVWDPPWHQGLLSEAARLQLGLM